METYLPVIQTTLAEWLQLSTENPLYPAAIAISVWLLTAILYSFRISGLNKKNLASERLRSTAETNLNDAQQQRQQAQDDLTAANEQLTAQQQTTEDEKQRALSAEQLVAQRNQHCVAIVQRLASSFDIGERPLPFTADLKSEELWQQHDKVITKFIDTLRTEQLAKTELQTFYQAEKDKLAAMELRLASLQTNLDNQTSLVLTLQTQNTTLQQQQNSAQQSLAETMQKHQADLARLTQFEQQVLRVTEKSVPPAIVTETPQLKSLFKKPEQPPQPEETVQAEAVIAAVADEPTADINDSPEQIESSSLLKTWYRKFTSKKPEATEPEPVLEEVEPEPVHEPEPAPQITSPEPAEETIEKTATVSALKGFYQKFTAKSEVEPEPVAEPESKQPDEEPASRIEDVADKVTETVESVKNLYGRFFSKKS